jgi:hypothetical protein
MEKLDGCYLYELLKQIYNLNKTLKNVIAVSGRHGKKEIPLALNLTGSHNKIMHFNVPRWIHLITLKQGFSIHKLHNEFY